MQVNEAHFCDEQDVSYDHRVYNKNQYNFCPVPEKGFDAVLFVAIGIICTCLAPRKHYAILMLILGALVQLLNIEVNIRELSNALNLWIGISPAKMFFYIFLPPLLLDSAVRIDFFIFKKVMPQVFVFAFGVVAANTVLLAVFMLYVLNLRNEGWEWTDAFLFACMIASTDALAVTAIMKDGAGPENLIILAEGESLFNDATSIVFFDLFWPRFKDSVNGELKHESLPTVVGKMALDVLWLATGGALIGFGGGILTRILFRFLQNQKGHSPVSEVGITLGISYLCYYIAESLVKVSGVIAVVVYGLYGAATTQWDISPAAREQKVFSGFWDVAQLLTNGIVFFYAGASATNFFYRCEEDLFHGDDSDAWTSIFAWLPGVYVGIFLLRFLEIAVVAPIVGYFGYKLRLNEIVFISLAGLRGALALILAQELLQYEFPEEEDNDFEQEKKVRAQSALWVCGFVLLTLLINAPGIPYLLKFCGLQNLSPLQLKYRKKSEDALLEYTRATIDDMKADSAAVMRGINWKQVDDFIYGHPGEQSGDEVTPSRTGGTTNGVRQGRVDDRWLLVESLSQPPSIPTSSAIQTRRKSLDDQYKATPTDEAPFGGSYREQASLLGQQEEGRKTEPMISTGTGHETGSSAVSGQKKINCVIVLYHNGNDFNLLQQAIDLPSNIKVFMERAEFPAKESTQKFFASTGSYFNLQRRNVDLTTLWPEPAGAGQPSSRDSRIVVRPMAAQKRDALTGSSLSRGLLEADMSGHDDDQDSARNLVLTEARFRMLMGLKKYFQQRRTNGYLSAQALRLLEWACDYNMEEPDIPLHVWDLIAKDIKNRFLIKLAFKVRYFLRKTDVAMKGWPSILEKIATPILKYTARGLTVLLAGDLHLAVESAIEYWIALNAYRTHSSWLVNAETSQDLAAEIRDQAQMVWSFIVDREIESPDRFEAIQTFRAKRAILYSQIGFVDELFECGLLEEVEHEHLKHALELKRADLSRTGAVLQNFDLTEFLTNVPCFANISSELFRSLVSTCQLRLFKGGDFISSDPAEQMESFSIHIIITGILRSSYTNNLGKTHEYHLGRGGIFGLLSALSGEHYPWMGKGYAELNSVGHGPSVLTIPRSTLMNIHSNATKGLLQYQQLELDLFRMAALYILEYMKEEFLSVATSLFLEKDDQESDLVAGGKKKGASKSSSLSETKKSFLQHFDGSPFATGSGKHASESDNAPQLVKASYEKAMEMLRNTKEGILQGELVLLPPNAKFVQSSSSVLVIGSISAGKKGPINLSAPMVLPMFAAKGAFPVEYRTGPHGAIVLSCVDKDAAKGSSSGPATSSQGGIDDGMRIGADMASLPSAAAQMHKELFD